MHVFFLRNCVRILPKKLYVYMRDNLTRQKGHFNSTISKFLAQRYGVWRYITNKAWKALMRKRQHRLQADIVVSEGFANFIAKDDRPANSHAVSSLQITTYNDPALHNTG